MVSKMRDEIVRTCREMEAFLIAKNEAYGNSAAEPIGIFAKGLARGSEYPGDDTVKDLCGYLIVRMAVKRMENGNG